MKMNKKARYMHLINSVFRFSNVGFNISALPTPIPHTICDPRYDEIGNNFKSIHSTK